MSLSKPRIIVVVVLLLAFAGAAHATAPTGYAWGENIGWLNWGTPEGAVNVPDSGDLTGYVWGENVGWISLNCVNTSSCGSVAYAVTRTGTTLSGYAWGENVGWISFNCSNTASCGAVSYDVAVDTSGVFTGYAWGENVGWISFNCSNTSSCGTVSYNVTSGASATATPTPAVGGPGGVVIVFTPTPEVTPTPAPTVVSTPTSTPILQASTTPPGPVPSPRVSPPLPGGPTVSPALFPPFGTMPSSGPTAPTGMVEPGPAIGFIDSVVSWLVSDHDYSWFAYGHSLASWLYGLSNGICSGPLALASCITTGFSILVVLSGILYALVTSGILALWLLFLFLLGLRQRDAEERSVDFGRRLVGSFGNRMISLVFWLGLVIVPLNLLFHPTIFSLALLVLFLIASGLRALVLRRTL